jgi:hypothetical protein
MTIYHIHTQSVYTVKYLTQGSLQALFFNDHRHGNSELTWNCVELQSWPVSRTCCTSPCSWPYTVQYTGVRGQGHTCISRPIQAIRVYQLVHHDDQSHQIFRVQHKVFLLHQVHQRPRQQAATTHSTHALH